MVEEEESEEAREKKERDAYITSLVADCPAFPPDPRQSHFFHHLDQWRKDPEVMEQKFIPMGGFRASAVDVGWLKDKAEQLVEDKFEEYGPAGVCGLIDLMISRSVQRLKVLIVHPDSERMTAEINMTTKDDHGYYEYRFAVVLPHDDEEGEGEEAAP